MKVANPYILLAQKSVLVNLNYRLSHVLNSATNLVYGVAMIAIWTAVSKGGVAIPQPYSLARLLHYATCAQVMVWLTVFRSADSRIAADVRSGDIAVQMARPLPFFPMIAAREWGEALYNLASKTCPEAMVFWLMGVFYVPGSLVQWATALAAIALAIQVAVCLSFLMGILSFWTTDVRWIKYVYSLTFALSGASVPCDLLPPPIARVALKLPFACQVFYPTRVFLGLGGVADLLTLAFWATTLTLLSALATSLARLRLEVHGG